MTANDAFYDAELPTDHRQAMQEQIDREIERERRAEAIDQYLMNCRAWVTYFDQGIAWHPRPPAKPLPIKDMDPEWRFNSAAMLLRNAAAHATRYAMGELAFPVPDDIANDLDHWQFERDRNPQRWMRTTPLFRALVRGLPGKRNRLTLLAQRARHYNTCPWRASSPGECTCEAGPLADDAIIRSIAGTAREIRKAEERAAKRRKEQAAAFPAFLDEWFAANPGQNPDTDEPWGVDADGFNHNEPHGPTDACEFDHCTGCGGYHCAYWCDGDGEDW